MTRSEVIAFCLTFPGAYEDYPFDPVADSSATAVMRHKGNKKSFALILPRKEQLYLNLKCDPFEADFLREVFTGIIPGWHMNKQHWNTVILGSDVPPEEIQRMITNSYNLTKPKMKTPSPQQKNTLL